MSTFLAVFFFLYGMLHFYLLVKARAALAMSAWGAALLALLMLFMMALPVVTRLLENAGMLVIARVAARVGFTWMAMLFLFFSASMVIDAVRLIVWLFGVAGATGARLPMPSARACFLAACVVSTGVAVYGWFEARSIRTEHVTLATGKVTSREGHIRIAQISDVHLGMSVGTDRLKRIVDAVREAKPDILVSTGDFVESRMADEEDALAMLRTLAPRLGKFAVTGNHEFYMGIGKAVAFTTKAGFRMLRGEVVDAGGAIVIAGVDDPAGPGYASTATNETHLLEAIPKGKFILLLKHRPLMDGPGMDTIDLQLSGHLHDGQIFPFRLIERFFFRMLAGLYDFPRHSARLYVSRGSGTWGPPIRFLTPPEVTVIDLVGPPGR